MLRYLLILALAVWLGGLTFYALIVVPIGTDILGSTGQGFITQRVTNQLNLVASGVLVLLLANVARRRGRLLTATWLVLAATQVALILMHPWLTFGDSARVEAIKRPGPTFDRPMLMVRRVQQIVTMCDARAVGQD